MKYTLKNENIESYNESDTFSFPKYTSQLINWANQNAQGTRPVVVGQMSELFPEFMDSGEEITIENWRDDREMVKHWVEDLVISKTFNGMYVQKAILASLAERRGTTYRLATPEEESVGIDGYVGNVPYSVKPDTYKTMGRLSETIAVKMIYYTKTKTGLTIEIED